MSSPRLAAVSLIENPLHYACEQIVGFIVQAIKFQKNLLIGENAPRHVMQDTIRLPGEGTIPCITLILGDDFTQVPALQESDHGLLPG